MTRRKFYNYETGKVVDEKFVRREWEYFNGTMPSLKRTFEEFCNGGFFGRELTPEECKRYRVGQRLGTTWDDM